MGKSGTDGARSLQLLKALLSDTIVPTPSQFLSVSRALLTLLKIANVLFCCLTFS